MLKKNKAQKRNPSRTPENSDALHPKESSLFPGLNSPEALELSALESRIMLDAAGAVTLAEAAADSMAQLDADGFEQLAQQLHAEHIAATEGRSARDLINDLHATDFSAPIDSPSSLQIVFIDDSVNDPEALLSNIPEGALVFTINGDSDGVEQMTAILDGYENVDAIHILSHGDQGELYLGNDVLNAESIQGEHLDELTRIGQSLSSDGDILIYGCDFTGGEDGLQAAILLGGVTGADIAASIDETGSANLGGDWDLETELGSIETQSISADNWTGLLAPAFVDLDNTDGAPGPSAFDDFETGNLTGGTGWVGNWVITGAGSGDIDVETDGGDSSMAIQDNDVQVARTVNLTGAETATLSFDYRRDSLESNEHLFVYISNSSTGGLVEIGRLSGSADDSSYLNFSADITSYIASDTTITFRTSSNWSGLTDEIFLDNISITSTATPPTGYEAEYTQNGAAIAIAGPNTEITDVDSASQASATITLTNPQAGDALSLISALPAGISGSVNAGGDVVTLTGVASNADYAAALQLVGFSSISGDVTERTINVVVNDGTADSSISVSTITVNPDNDGDGVADRYDIDDDNDGILDINESPTVQVTLDVVTAIPAGAIPGNPNGIRLSDSTGQYVVDIYEGSNTTDDSYTFNTTTGRIESDGAGGIDETEIVELVYTTVNSPTQFNLQTIQILDIDSLSNGPGATGFRDAYAFSELGTWQPLGTGGAASPAGAVVSVDTGNADSVGQFIITDPDGGNNLNDIGSFAQLTSIDATVSDVLLNMTGEIDNHNATFQFESEHETASLYVFNAGAGDIAWGFFPQMTITVPPADAPDTDGDGVIDQYDLDSDNDGITDNVEAQTTAGYIDPGTFVDVDGDGLNDIYDADTSSTNPNASVGLTPVNTDGRDDADYLDWDSDNDTISDLAEAGHGVTQAAIDASGDADGDGILDVVDGVSGRDVNDDDLTGSNFNLSDSNSDVAADGSDAIPLINDFDYRDADADNDGIAAYDDLDDDNDGVLDTVEFNFTNFDPSSYLNTAGTASIQTDGSVRLSEALGNQAGSVMSDILIDMNYDFTMSFEVYLGTDDNGADGIAFVLHNDPDGDTAVGAPGYGVGAHGIEDGIAIEFDTWQNGGELANDHTSVWDTDTGDFEWNPNHADYLLNPVDLGNIEDGAYHDVTVSWDADTQTLTYTFDGNNVGSITGDLVNDYFGGAEAVHFGWTASTGGAVNEHSVRIDNFSGHLENFDTDGDGLSNHIDIDSDNDGITDNVEAQSTGRYIAPSGMPGAGFTDIDGDGLDDVYDADTGGAANSLGLTPVNTDQLDTPDMYDTDSDNDGTSDADEAGHGVDQATIDASGDTDGDGLNDAVDDVNGWDVNDNDYVAGSFTLADSDNDTSSDGLSAASTQRDFDYRDNIETNNPPTLQIANGGTVTQTDIDAGNVVLGDNLVFNGGFESGVTGYVSSYDYVGTVTETRAPGDNDPLGMAALNGTTYGLIDNNRVADDLTGFFNNTSAQEGDTFGLFDINDSALPFWETGVNIDDDQQYVFSAFLANINDDNNLIRPDVSFVVVDNLGNTTTLVSTGELQSGGATTAWEEFSAIYNPVDGVTSARIQLISNVSGFVGNDLALDNVQMRSVSLDADADGVADNVDFETTFTEGDAPVALTSTPDVSVSDLGDQDIVSFDVDISSISTDGASETISFAGQTLVYGTPSSGTITQGATDFDYSYDGNGSLSFTNNAGAAIAMPEGDIATLLTTFTYQNTDEDPTAGDRTVTYQVTDDGGAVSSLGVSTITVVPVNDAPTASAGAVSTAINTPVSGAVSIADVDSTPTASLSSGPSAGSVTVNPNGTYTYTPNFLFVGVDSFDVLVDDGDGASVTVTVNVSVGILNQPPVADDDAQTTDEDVAVSGAVTLSDPNGDTVTASLGSAPTNGTATVNPDGTYTYTPDADFFGTDTFEVLADDGNGATDTATVTITVNPINDNPVAADDSQTTDEDVAVNGAVTLSDVDGDTVTASLGSAPANGTATVNPDGTYTYTPNADFNGTDTFTISADDGNGGTDVATISITVNPVNDAPTGTAAPATTNEDTAVSGAIVTNDVDGDSVTATLTTPPANGTAVVLSNGTYTYTPAPDFNGTDSFVVQLNDSNGGLTDVTVTVTVDPIQDAPVAADDVQTTNEDVAVNGAVALSDVDGDTVTASLGSAPLNGTAAVNPDGTYTYTPNADFNGTDTFTVSADDGNGGTDVATVTITVDPVNDAPVAGNDAQTTDEDVAINGAVALSDVDGDTVTASLGTAPTNGTVSVNTDGTYTYTPNADFNGTDTFTISASDGNGGTDTATVTITVDPVNDNPVAADDAQTTDEDVAVNGAVALSDVDGDTVTASLGSAPANGTATVNPDGTYTYTPNADFNGTDTFTISADDGNGGTDIATVTITVNAVNDAPTGTAAPATVNEDASVNGTVVTNDVDGDTVTATLDTAPANGTVTVNPDGTYTYTPAPDFNGTDSFVVQLDDGNGGTTDVTVSVTVDPVNDNPVAADDTQTTDEDVAVNGAVALSDVDGETVTASLGTAPLNGTAVVNTDGTYTYTPNADFNGTDTFTVSANDGNGGTDVATVTITVNAVNDAPTGTAAPVTVDEDASVNGTVVSNDVDGDTVTATLDTAPANGTVTVNPDGTYTYTPAPDFNGTDSFVVQLDDGNGGTTDVTVSVTVDPVNDNPVAADDTQTTNEDVAVNGAVALSDVDGDTVTASLGTAPLNGTTVVNPDGTYTYTPNADFNGTDTFTIAADDGNGGTDVATVTITVNAVNDAPTGTAAPVTVDEDASVNGTVVSNDVDGDTVTATLDTAPANGSVTVNPDGTYTYTPNADFNGTDSFVVQLDDGNGGTTDVTVTITVDPIQDAPVAADDAQTTDEDIAVNGAVALSDVDGDTVTASLGTAPLNGTAVVNPDGTYTYTPNADFNGTDTFTISADDGNGGTDVATVTITVDPVNDAPVAADESQTTDEDVAVNGAVALSDVDGDTVTASLGTAPTNGTVSVNTDGTYTYTPNADFNGTDTFTISASDGNGGTDTATVTITVDPVNDNPVAADDAQTTDEDVAVNGAVALSDVDGDTVTASLGSAPLNGTAIVNTDGTYTYTPNADFNGTDTFTISADDGNGGTDVATVTITVNAVNDAPTGTAAPATVNEDASVNGTVVSNDVDGDTVTATLGAAPANGTVTVNPNGTYTYTPAPDFNGTDSFVVQLDDGNGGTTDVTVSVTVDPVNDNPVAADDAQTTDEEAPVSGAIALTDVDGDVITASLGTAPANGTATVNPDGTYTYTPNADFNGTDTFTVSADDGNGGTDVATVTITVDAVNDAPTGTAANGTTNEDTPVNGSVISNDVDGDTVIASLDTAPASGTAIVNGDGTYTYTPNAHFFGNDSFVVLLDDGNGGTNTVSVSVTVNPVNDAPIAGDDARSTNEDAAIAGAVALTDVDGDTITASLGTAPLNGTAVVNTDGTYTYTPNADFNGTDTFTVSANDGNGGTDVATVTITVNAVNDAPTGTAAPVTVDEDTSVNGSITISDVDGDSVSATLDTPPASGSVVLNIDRTYTYTPDPNFTGSDSFVVLLDDGNGGTSTVSVSVTVNPVNDAPVALDDTQTTDEDTSIAGAVALSDIDGDIVTASLGTAPTNGTAVVNTDGTYTYTPNTNFNGTDTFTVSADDGNGGTDVATVTITVNAVTDAPTGTADDAITDEDTPVSGVVITDDIDGDTVTTSLDTAPTNGTVVVNTDGTYTYTPNADFNGMDSFIVLLDDGNGGTNTVTVSVIIDPVNDNPVAGDDSHVTDEDAPVAGAVSLTDVDGDTITASLGTTAPSNGSVVVNTDGTYIYTPNADFNGTDTFTISADDGNGGTDIATVTITVDPVNDAPTGTSANVTTDEDTSVNGAVASNDIDGDTVTASLDTPPASGVVSVNGDGTYTYTPNADFYGNDSFVVLLDDGNGGTSTVTTSVTINPINDDPVAGNDTRSTDEDTSVAGTVALTDVDGDTVTASLGSAPLNGTAVVNPDGTYTYTPNANFNGTDTFTISADDGNGGTDVATVTITVDPVNDAPTGTAAPISTDEDTAISGAVVTNDIDGDTVVATLSTAPTNGTVIVNSDGTYTYTPASDYVGSDSFVVLLDDGNGGTSTVSVSATIGAINDNPVAAEDAQTTDEDVAVNGAVTLSDVDGDTVTASLGTAPTNGTATVNPDGTYTYTPNADFNGTDTFTVSADDGNGGTDVATVTITVDPVNDAPVAADDSQTTDEDVAINGAVALSDVDGDTVTASLGTAPTNGTVTVNTDGTYTYTPNADFTGTDTFTISASDGNGGTDTATVTITVDPVNDNPVAADDAQTTDEDIAVNGAVALSDVDGDTVTASLGTAPLNGTAVVNPDGTYTYTPNADFNGTDTFTISADDGNGGTDVATVTITVDAVNDAPVAADDSQTTDEDIAINGAVALSDVDGDTVTASLGTAPTNGTVTVNTDGTYTYTPNADFTGTDTFTISASDGNGGTDTATVAITVDPVNDNPVAADDSQTTDEDVAVNGAVALSDVDGDTVTASLGTAPLNGTAVVNTDGTYTYTPNADFNGTDTFTISADDGNGGTDVATVTITVNAVNDAPTGTSAPATVNEDASVNGTVVSNDVDGDTVTATLGAAPANGTVTVNPDGTYTYTPAPDFNGTDSFVVQLDDGNGGTTDVTVSVTVDPVNDSPETVQSIADRTGVDGQSVTPIETAQAFSDLDGDPLTFSATGLPTGLQIDPESGVITGTLDSNASQQGPYTVTVTATDSAGATTTSDFLINAINDPVEARPATPINLQDGQVIDLPVTNLFNSPDGDRLSYAVSGLPDGLQFDTRTGVISGTVPSDASENGPFTITVTADDGQGGSATTDLLLDVTNPAPTAVPGSADAIPNLIPGEPTRIDTSAFIIDPDGDSLTFTAAGLPEGLSIDPDTGLVTGTPPQTATNDTPYTITLTVTDGQGGTVTTQFEVIVGRNAAAPVQELIDLGTHNDKNVAESVEVTEAPTTINEVISPNQLAKTETRITDTLYTEPSWDGRMATDSQNFNFQGGVSRSQVSLGDSDGDLIVEATIREGIVYVQLWETLSTSSTEMTNWLIEAIDGELPAWIDVTDTGLLIVNRPADATEVSFRVRAILDGTDVLSGEYEIDLSSGEVTLDGQVERRPANFNEQVEWKSHQSERQAASLTAALNLTK